MTSSISWNATPMRSPNSSTGSRYSSGASPKMTPTSAAACDERAGLVGEHLQVVLDRVLARARADGLVQLPEHEPLEGVRLDA